MKLIIIIYYLGLMARQDFFTHFRPSQLIGGTKTGSPEKNRLITRKQNLACLTYDPSGLKATAVR